jgi:glycosyltransferase involved in cell wall biosynthesis
MIKTTHVITDLDTGGAESMLHKLVERMDRNKFDIRVVSLTENGSIGEKIEALGIPVVALYMKKGRPPSPASLSRFRQEIKNNRPTVIQTWMYHADLIGGVVGALARVPVVWNIRHSNLVPGMDKKSTIWSRRWCAILSRWIPVKIVCCAESAAQIHASIGYCSKKLIVIPNGFDTQRFRPDQEAVHLLRRELKIREDAILLGMVARHSPQKDHENFLQAARILSSRCAAHFVLCGKGMDWDNPSIADKIKELGLVSRFHLLGERRDMPQIYAALDVACLSSAFGEGFPNVIGEAMACAVPCVTTNVGDSASLVDDGGLVVQPKNAHALADACWQLIKPGSETKRLEMGRRARHQISTRFDIAGIVKQYQNLYELLSGKPKKARGHRCL